MVVDIKDSLSLIPSLLKVDEYPDVRTPILYLIIVLLCALVYRLGFAKKLSLGKNIIVYLLLALGCTILTFFAIFLPVTESLIVAAALLGIYKFRLHQDKKAG